jgi:outer membrane protein assembly factor BamB
MRCVGICLLLLAPHAWADDWPQWRGPRRDGISRESGWLDGWPVGQKPRVAWRAEAGKGHSAVVVSRGRAFTLGWDGKQDTVFCFDADSGKLLWKQSYPCRGILQWPGPRSTPTVEEDAVYTLGQHGQLFAWDARTGIKRWGTALPERYSPDVDYGSAWSPLVEGDLLILGAGSHGLALHKKDGKPAWGDDGQHGACASPVPFSHEGKRAVAVITLNPGRDSATLVGVEADSGKVLWKSAPWPEKWGAACADPIIRDGKVFVATAEQYKRCARFTIQGGGLKQDWINPQLKCYTGGCVLLEGHLYGVNSVGILTCLDWETGKEKWGERGYGQYGTLMAADGKLIVQAHDSGELSIVEASSATFKQLRRAKVFDGPPATFTVPVLANQRIYCRSYHGEVVCLDLRKRG